MKWEVRGAIKKTGEDVVKTYSAESEEAATFLAKNDGILVSSIDLLIDMEAVHEARSAPAQTPVMSYQSPRSAAGAAPPYTGLTIAGTVLRMYAYVCYVVGVLVLIGAVVAIVPAMNSQGGGPGFGLMVFGTIIGPAIAILFAAAVAHGLGAACVALRDIARNSWN